MATRRSFLTAAAALAASAAAPRSVPAQDKNPEFLFVQNAKSMTYDKAKGRLTLAGVSPVTVFFSDRPDRIAGNMATTRFVPFWSEGKDSFLKDPPNANVSVFGAGQVTDVVVVLGAPALSGETLTYTVKVLQGELPAKGGPVSVFIDIIGMPMTPLSYAGVDRRMWRRAYYR